MNTLSEKQIVLNELKKQSELLCLITNKSKSEAEFKIKEIEEALIFIQIPDLQDLLNFVNDKIDEELNKKYLFECLKSKIILINSHYGIKPNDEKLSINLSIMKNNLSSVTVEIIQTQIDEINDLIKKLKIVDDVKVGN